LSEVVFWDRKLSRSMKIFGRLLLGWQIIEPRFDKSKKGRSPWVLNCECTEYRREKIPTETSPEARIFTERAVCSCVYRVRYLRCDSLNRPVQLLLFITVLICAASCGHSVWGQGRPGAPDKSQLCTRENALEMIKQQVALSKTIDYNFRRVTVLVRAADLLWPYEKERARAAFAEAFELAIEQEKENDRVGPRSIILRLQYPDYRYVVIRAVAKRDPAWAKLLTRQILKPENAGGKASGPRDSFHDLLTSERLLQLAREMLSTDINAALDLAKVSLNYPASAMLTRFLYNLAAVDQQRADQFYLLALGTYGEKPLEEFLYLQAYPFAWRDLLNTPIFVFFYDIPASYVPNPSLQRELVRVMLRRAQQQLEVPQEDTYRDTSGRLLPSAVHLLKGLMRLEPQVATSLPDLLPSLTQAREKILVSLSADIQKTLLQPGREISTTPDQTFDEELELAEKIADVNERNSLIASAVLGSEKEPLAKVVQAIDKIADSNLRAHFFEWLYFHRAAAAIRGKQFDEAERLAAKVDGLEQRAYLHTEIARGLLSRDDTQTHARELLEDAISEAKKAGVNIFAARTLLTASSLYAKVELGRSISVLGDAIDCINRIETPDFFRDDQALTKSPERRTRGGVYGGEYELRFYMPGLDPERAFNEMARVDFETSLAQSSALTDKLQRAMSSLAIADVCLAQTQQQPPKQKPARKTPPPQ